MSPASYLAAPPRVAIGSIPPVNSLLWAAIAFLAAVLVAGTASVLVLGLRAWRDLRALGRLLLEESERLVERIEAGDARVVRIAARAQELARALERLQARRARLRVLLDATGELRDLAAAARAYVGK